ncbi:MAG: hypothetical protein RIA69_08205 [Cyclobacteriaceae bacterium]
MNRYWIISVIFFLVIASASAQKDPRVNVKPLNISGFNAQFTADGAYLVFTSPNYGGLYYYHFKSKSQQVITEASGAGFNARVERGMVIYQKEKEVNEWIAFDLGTRETNDYISQTDVQKSASSLTTKNTRDEDPVIEATPTSDLRAIKLTFASGLSKLIAPLGINDYLNVSISPSRHQLLFRVSGVGTYVTDFDGNIISDLGNVEFPKWAGNDKILCTETVDDGYNYIESEIFLKTIDDGMKWPLTEETDAIALYPNINDALDKVVFNTPGGELYLVEINGL